jgi:hypothetical protein
VKAFEPEFTEDKVKSAFRDTDGEDVWNFACALAAQMVHEWFIPTVWDHLRNPAL